MKFFLILEEVGTILAWMVVLAVLGVLSGIYLACAYLVIKWILQ
jgi:hypothetical protein